MANMLDWNTLGHKVKAYIDPDSGIDTEQKAFPILMVATLLGPVNTNFVKIIG
ncbi:MAG: hypothetical protein N0C89_09295 [Candidatus Thiodiazotropha endolucinida]|nr:hypothetical protein [Candidatus Thiodiazotropha taylori]MCG8096959.1 hypothetical protein [Candidatus Thiodiazotropha endolucinida]MCG8062391.1 hypothetical protein [Candidatus Thiodiazotropha taylori]MCG8064327.1 hypothetical protein [Candidatus Thiodiazotropha taylori]MCW4330413.1 hypothetical protein [Candidatus Thiodiazotropha endolucinida]